ncbi:MAG: hypothetical protein AB8F74_14290 [Saprospiraceae bacterium]
MKKRIEAFVSCAYFQKKVESAGVDYFSMHILSRVHIQLLGEIGIPKAITSAVQAMVIQSFN